MGDDFEESGGGGGEAAWMATFADMMTLLLTFFVLLISFANMDVVKFRMMLGSVNNAMGVKYPHPGQIPAVSTSAVQLSETEGSSRLDILQENFSILNAIRQSIQDANLDGLVEAELSERGVIVRVKGQVLFDLGDATLRPDGTTILDSIGQLSETFRTQLMIEGHTDGLPVSTSQFPSNWELSAARAIAAMRYFVDRQLVPADRIGVAGYADRRPIAPNDTPENRARNRRIEFVFIRMTAPEGSQPDAPPVLNVSPGQRLQPIAGPVGPPSLPPLGAARPVPLTSGE
jgi:chemotaxis protein MotB